MTSPPRFRVVCTAGHVDHGKSRLVEALTGTHPDRLPEERRREMSIDLGFAYLSLPHGLEVAFIDVPGHRDFIANMLAGVGGVDAALLVVAADGGVMPQTREHLAILQMLQIPRGLVVLTKSDLVPDPDRRERVVAQVRAFLEGTFLETAPLLWVSAHTGEGLEALRTALLTLLEQVSPRPDYGRPRLAVDRAFSLPGFGTVVTGTLVDGTWQVDDLVEVLPSGRQARIRGMQAHRRPCTHAAPGMRLALNLSGISHKEIRRGDVVAAAGIYRPTTRLDVRLQVWKATPRPLRHLDVLKLFLWSAAVMARVRLLGQEALPPGASGVAQLELARPVVAAPGDRFILRLPSPDGLLAGGEVLDPHPRFKYRKGDRKARTRLAFLAREGRVGLWRSYMEEGRVFSETQLRHWFTEEEKEHAVARGRHEGWLLTLNVGHQRFFLSPHGWQKWKHRLLHEVRAFHQKRPWLPGIPKETLRAQLGLEPLLFNALLTEMASDHQVVLHGPRVALPDFQPHLPQEMHIRVKAAMARLLKQKPAHPRQAWIEALGPEIYTFLVEQGELVPLTERVVVSAADFQAWVAQVEALFRQHPALRVAQVRDALGLSRRITIALLEYLDRLGYTRREGDFRVWQKER